MLELTKKILSLTDEERAILYQRLFNTDDGKLVIEDLKLRCFDSVPTIPDEGIIDPYRTHVNEGRRSVLKHIQTQLDFRPQPQPINEEDRNV